MERQELEVQVREEIGKGSLRSLRLDNRVPAIFYGPHVKTPVCVTVKWNDVKKVLQAGRSVFITLKSADPELNGKTAVIKEEQVHPLSGKLVHVDLYEVR